MSRNKFPVTRRQALAVGVGATIGSVTLPRQWFTNSPDPTPQIDAGSWPMERHNPARTGYVPNETGPTKDPVVAWQTTLDSDSIGHALVSSGKLVCVTSNHAVTAVDAATGTQQWRTTHFGTLPWEDMRLGMAPWSDMPVLIEAASILGDNRLFVGSNTALYAVTPADGTAQWAYESTNLSETLYAGNTVYVLGNVLAAVDATSGLERWKTDGAGVSPKAYAQEYIVGPVLDRENVIGAVDAASGSMQWTRDIDLNDVSPPGPCITNETIYCGSGPLYALNLADGSTQWTQSLGTVEADIKPVSDGTTVYVVINETNRVLALDAQTGNVRWRTNIDEIPDDSAPVLTDETLYVALRYGIVALDPVTGDERFRVRLSETEGFTTSPIVTGDTLYVSIDKTLYALTDQ